MLQAANDSILTRVIAGEYPAFALISRAGADGPEIDVLILEESHCSSLKEIHMEGEAAYLILLPYCAIGERGFEIAIKDAPIRVCRVVGRQCIAVDAALGILPEPSNFVTNIGFDINDADFAGMVERIIQKEIAFGSGANFVLKRNMSGRILGFTHHDAIGYFKRLLSAESGAYWTHLVCLPHLTLVGATPERHVSCTNRVMAMTPISGTLRTGDRVVSKQEILNFIHDKKETEELLMVVDEELKMVSSLCTDGGHILGPSLRHMSKLIHTEYAITGQTDAAPLDILHRTMFAPTVMGSPLRNAARVIARHEPTPRGYYSGVVALIEPESDGGYRDMDSAILIRTAIISKDGGVAIPVGATIVRDSVPMKEAAETAIKAASILSALSAQSDGVSGLDEISAALKARGEQISYFWRQSPSIRSFISEALDGRSCAILDAEDDFTNMIAVILTSAGMDVKVMEPSPDLNLNDVDLVIFGPGPGDPQGLADPRIRAMHYLVNNRLSSGQPFLAVCLSHQILSSILGLPLSRLPKPNQGTQVEVTTPDGSVEAMGFYNAFSAVSPSVVMQSRWGTVKVSSHAPSGQVYALSGQFFESVQYHLESVLSIHGPDTLINLAANVLHRHQSAVGGQPYGA